MGSVNNGSKINQSIKPNSATPAGGTPKSSTTPSGVTPQGNTPPSGVTPSSVTPRSVTPQGNTPVNSQYGRTNQLQDVSTRPALLAVTPGGLTPSRSLSILKNGPASDTFSPGNSLFVGSLDGTTRPSLLATTPGGVTPGGVTPGSVTPGSVTPGGVTPGGVTPGGVTPVGVLVIDDPFNTLPSLGEPHENAVIDVVKKYAPDATIAHYDLNFGGGDGKLPVLTATGDNSLDKQIDSWSTLPGDSAAILADALSKNPNTKVINTSWGANKLGLYDNLYTGVINPDNTDLNNPQSVTTLATQLGIPASTIEGVRTEFANYRAGGSTDPAVFKALSSTKNSIELQNALAKYTDSRLNAPDSVFSKGLETYQKTTKLLSDNGIAVVASYGNSGDGYGSWTYNQYKAGSPDSEVNYMAMSDNVISVAASTDNNPNGTITDFSSRGGGKWKPTLAADGLEVAGLIDKDGNGLPDGSGTSFSAPTVAGTVAELFAKDPNMTPEKARQILTSTAFNTPATPEEEGAGILNIPGAFSSLSVTPGGVTPGGVTPGGVTPGGVTPGGVTPGGLTPVNITAEQARFLRPIAHNFKKVAIGGDNDTTSITEADLKAVEARNPQRPTLVWAAQTLMQDPALLQQLLGMDGNTTNGFTYEELLSILNNQNP